MRDWRDLARSGLRRLNLARQRRRFARASQSAASAAGPEAYRSVAQYWTRHNVTSHRAFATPEKSLEHFHWRCDQYPGYLNLMPVSGMDGKAVLDYGCGPGHDLVGFAHYSKPALLVGADVSPSSLSEAGARLDLHGVHPKLVQLDGASSLPFPTGTFDYVHSSGVLHHVPDLHATLLELRRILRPDGRARVMVYHRDSLWMHLYVAWVLRYRDQMISPELPIDQAFSMSTDGPECPIANCYSSSEFADAAQGAGFRAELVGSACSLFERELGASVLFRACMDERLERPHREFLIGLTQDEHGTLLHRGIPAGVDLVMELRPA